MTTGLSISQMVVSDSISLSFPFLSLRGVATQWLRRSNPQDRWQICLGIASPLSRLAKTEEHQFPPLIGAVNAVRLARERKMTRVSGNEICGADSAARRGTGPASG